jgi:L-cystine uptake protein TcyP (sodium:dicarboxylate symporter family)
MSSPDQVAMLNPYAPPSTESAFGRQRRETISLRAVCSWLVGIGLLQVVMSTCSINFLQRTVAVINIRLAVLHLCVMVGVALCATFVLMRHHRTPSAIVVAELVNLVQWIALPVNVQILLWIRYTDQRVRQSDLQGFGMVWLLSSVAIAALCGLMHSMRGKSSSPN